MWESKLQIWANHYYCSVSCQLAPGSNYRPVSLRGISWINGSDLWKLNFSTAKRKLLAVIQLIPSRLSERGGTCVLVYVAPQTGAIVKMAMSCAYAVLCTQSLFDMNVVITTKWPCVREAFDCFNNDVCATFCGRVTVSGMKGGARKSATSKGQRVAFNPLAPNDHCTGQFFATPECRMTSTMVTSGKVEKRVFSEAKGRSVVFQISSIQCLVFCCCFFTRMRGFREAST